MAAKLQCEICGGKLIGKPGGIFECENCGTEYSTEWARAKIQEITGTVKVEGTVEVSGKVQVEGPVQVDSSANKTALLKRGQQALEDGEWEIARQHFDQVLNIEATCGEAFLGLSMAAAEISSREEYGKTYSAADSPLRINKNTNVLRARTYDAALEAWFSELDRKGRIADQKKQSAMERAREQAQQRRERDAKRLEPIRQRNAAASGMLVAGLRHTIGLRVDGTVLAVGKNKYHQCDVSIWRDVVAVAAGDDHTVGLRANGTVLAVGSKNMLQQKVGRWTNIASIAAGDNYTVGLHADGTAIVMGYSWEGPRAVFDVSGWSDVIEVVASPGNIFGLRADGTVVTARKQGNQSNILNNWTDIVAIAAGTEHFIGLRADGTVLAAGTSGWGECDVSGWSDIVAVDAGVGFTVGLHADGTVVAVGNNHNNRCDVNNWTDVVAIAAGSAYIVGLHADGTVVTAGLNDSETRDVSGWTDVVAVIAGHDHLLGLRSDGTVVAAGNNQDGECNVSDWKLFNSIDTVKAEQKAFQDERRAAAEKAEAERKAHKDRLKKESTDLHVELANLKGLFTAKRRKEIETRLAQIETELKNLG